MPNVLNSHTAIQHLLGHLAPAEAIIEVVIPRVPQAFNVKKLQANGKLLAEDMLDSVKTLAPGKHKPHASSYSVVVTEDEAGERTYLALDKQHVDRGGFGKVRYGQNLESSEFFAVKLQPFGSAAVNEHQVLAALDDDLGQVIRTKHPKAADEKSYLQHIQVMQLAHGDNLEKFLSKRLPLSAYQWVTLVRNMIVEVTQLHQNGFLHRDIKLKNFVYDKLTETIRLIDKGIAIPLTTSVLDNVRGTPTIFAPEIINLVLQQGLAIQVNYGVATDVFALGISIAELFGFAQLVERSDDELKMIANDVNCHYYKKTLLLQSLESKQLPVTLRKLPDESMRYRVLTFLHQMTDPNPLRRPSLAIVTDFFIAMQRESVTTPKRLPPICMVPISVLVDVESDDLIEYFEVMRQFSRVVLLDQQRQCTGWKLMRLRYMLECHDIVVDDRCYQGHPEKPLSTAEFVNQLTRGLSSYEGIVYVSQQVVAMPAHVMVLSDIENGKDIVEAYWRSLHAVKPLLKLIGDKLREDITRIQTKYGNKNKTANQRVQFIETAIADLRFCPDPKSIATLLTELQTQMISPSYFSNSARTDSYKHITTLLQLVTLAQQTPQSPTATPILSLFSPSNRFDRGYSSELAERGRGVSTSTADGMKFTTRASR